jgi:hypothetical protein
MGFFGPDPNDIYKTAMNFDQVNTDFQKQIGQQMFNPNSAYNQRQLGGIQQQGMDQINNNWNMSNKLAAMGRGLGAQQRGNAFASQTGESMFKGFNGALGQNAQMGMGLLGQGLQGDSSNMQMQQAAAMAQANTMNQNSANRMGFINSAMGLAGQFMPVLGI